MKDNSNKKEKKGSFISRLSKRVFIALAVIFALVVLVVGVLVGVFFALKSSGRLSMEERRNEQISAIPDYVYDPNIVNHEGKKYRYNEDLTTILFMGVDTGKVQLEHEANMLDIARRRAEENGTDIEYELEKFQNRLVEQGGSLVIEDGVGQADVLMLLVIDEKNEQATIISIDRNSMSYFEAFDAEGNSYGSSEGQLALAYSYGDGSHLSCEMTVGAVSDFLYEVPIHAYYSMKYAAIMELNDAVGGVEVTIPTDMTMVSQYLKEGETIKLDGKRAALFLSARQNVGDGSNAGRLERQKQYIFSFIDTAIDAVKKDWGLPTRLYNSLASNSCTDLSADEVVYLADLASRVDVTYHSISGTTDTSSGIAQFRPDEEELWCMILDIFYICED